MMVRSGGDAVGGRNRLRQSGCDANVLFDDCCCTRDGEVEVREE